MNEHDRRLDLGKCVLVCEWCQSFMTLGPGGTVAYCETCSDDANLYGCLAPAPTHVWNAEESDLPTIGGMLDAQKQVKALLPSPSIPRVVKNSALPLTNSDGERVLAWRIPRLLKPFKFAHVIGMDKAKQDFVLDIHVHPDNWDEFIRGVMLDGTWDKIRDRESKL